tara:strand:+ start:1213 stop:1599 length:387 start_codon:yes stop_codon:yes gene_type:complete
MTDSWHTPQWVLDMFPDFWDPCPFNPDWNESMPDALEINWDETKIFVNPPYSNPLPWVEKVLDTKLSHNMAGKKSTIVMLLKHDTSTRWYKLLHEAGARILMFSGRLSFTNPDFKEMKSPHPSILVVI